MTGGGPKLPKVFFKFGDGGSKCLTTAVGTFHCGIEYCASNEQCVYRFPNNYGASVVRRTHQMKRFPGPVTGTYGADKGLWELAVIRFQEDGQWEITYKTKITCDVLGWLSEAEVDEVLGKIKKLRKRRPRPACTSTIGDPT